MSTDHHSGLEEVRALSSSICQIDGKNLLYRGYSIEDMATSLSFEEVVYLLWQGRLPGTTELQRFRNSISESFELPYEIAEVINHLPRSVHPMDALRTAVSHMSCYDTGIEETTAEATLEKATKILARIPSVLAGFERHRKGKALGKPRKDLSISGNFLFLLHGEEPDDITIKALETSMILYAEHELNASAFTARIVAGTGADVHACVTAALATLKGDLHGGANQKAAEMIIRLHDPAEASDYIDDELVNHRRIMGFGHRVYKSGDPRVPILKELSRGLCNARNLQHKFEIAEKIETVMMERKGLLPNVDFYSGLLYFALGFPTDVYTGVFAMARTAGWVAHILEQYANNRLIRPRAEYTGPAYRPIGPIAERI